MILYRSPLKESQQFFYNYRRDIRQGDEPVIFCSDNPEKSNHYGNIQRIFKATNRTLDLRKKNDRRVIELVDYAIIFFNEWDPFIPDEYEEAPSKEEEFDLVYNSLNPKDIVESAQAWDNIEFINYLYDETKIFDKYDGCITGDGAIFFEITKDNLVSVKNMNETTQKIKAYHGSPVPITRFDKNFSAQGVFWFSEDKDKILRGDSGASSVKYIMEVILKVTKTAGWDEYDKLGLGQIEDMGYDSILLDDDWIIFKNKNIKIVKTEEVKK